MSEDLIQIVIDPEDVTILYFRTEPGRDGIPLPVTLGAPQVSIDNGVTWLPLDLSVDKLGVPAYPWVVAGPGVPAGRTFDHQVSETITKCLVQTVDTVEIKTKAFIIRAVRPWKQ